MSDQPLLPAAPDPPELPQTWQLRLYVAGQTPRTRAALVQLQALCDAHLAGRYTIEVIDLLETPDLARSEQIVALPTLVRQLPLPIRKVIGDLSDAERVLVGLEIWRD